MTRLDPSEDQINIAFVQWCHLHHDGRELVYHVPNEAKRSRAGHGIMIGKGLVVGQPDLCIPIGKGGWLSLHLELKRFGERPTVKQASRMEVLMAAGNYCTWADTLEHAISVTESYMAGKLQREGFIHYSHPVYIP